MTYPGDIIKSWNVTTRNLPINLKTEIKWKNSWKGQFIKTDIRINRKPEYFYNC